MSNNQIFKINYDSVVDEGYKVIEVNISESAENLYAVCTPVKMD
ncbi:hypothetical protein [Oceanobacillus zhaokaii]|nr:hypothetical protein [Oceanobacillus zhaokaii]